MPDTLLIAAYAAIVATTSLVWNIVRDVVQARRTVRLFLEMGGVVQIGPKVVSVMLTLRVTNTSMTRDLEIRSVDFDGGGLIWMTPDYEGGVRSATTPDGLLPALLTPAKSVEIPIYLSAQTLAGFSATTGITVQDSAGRTHRVNQHHLKAMKARIRKTAAMAAGDPHYLAVRR
jgi:hypothetical protein